VSVATVVGALVLATAPAHALLSVSPSHVELTPGTHRVISIDTYSPYGASITAHVAGLTLDPRGRPRLVRPGDAGPLLRLSASTLRAARGHAQLTITARPASSAAVGDHTAVVLFEATQRGTAGVLLRLRVGLIVSVRIPGKVVHRLALGARASVLRTRRTIEVAVANHGNVTEHIDNSRLTLVVVRGGRTVAVLRPSQRDFLPHSQGFVVFSYSQRLRGVCVARVGLRQSTGLTVRRYRLRL
jgi:hypothetical protein